MWNPEVKKPVFALSGVTFFWKHKNAHLSLGCKSQKRKNVKKLLKIGPNLFVCFFNFSITTIQFILVFAYPVKSAWKCAFGEFRNLKKRYTKNFKNAAFSKNPLAGLRKHRKKLFLTRVNKSDGRSAYVFQKSDFFVFFKKIAVESGRYWNPRWPNQLAKAWSKNTPKKDRFSENHSRRDPNYFLEKRSFFTFFKGTKNRSKNEHHFFQERTVRRAFCCKNHSKIEKNRATHLGYFW